MYPFLNVGPLHLGTFGLLLWLAAVVATAVLQWNFRRHGVDGDAIGIVAVVVIAGILGAKLWHELQDVRELQAALRQIGLPGWHDPWRVVLGFLHWFQAGFAWYGGLVAGIAALAWQGAKTRFAGGGRPVGGLRMLDLAAPAAAIGYGVGRIGCLTSGDGDYGKNTTLPWGVHMRWDALVPTNPPGAAVQPTPVYELITSTVIFWVLWRLGRGERPVGWITGLYLVLMGVARFLVEFERINPRLYFGMSNAQVAALGSVVAGAVLMVWARGRATAWTPAASREAA